MAKIGITGGSGTGKTTLSQQHTSVCHGDDYIDLGWSEASEHFADLLDSPLFDCFEGVSLPRALRKWLANHPEGKPLTTLIVLTKPHRPQTQGQATQAKGHDTVLKEIMPELRRRGVVIERR